VGPIHPRGCKIGTDGAGMATSVSCCWHHGRKSVRPTRQRIQAQQLLIHGWRRMLTSSNSVNNKVVAIGSAKATVLLMPADDDPRDAMGENLDAMCEKMPPLAWRPPREGSVLACCSHTIPFV
jgi:hypothetical protein